MSVEYSDITFERLGHASVRIETEDGRVAYIDPWSDVLGGRDPQDADVVLVTHDDFDHYDPDAIASVSTDATTVVAYEHIDTSDLTAAESIRSLVADGELTVDGITAHAVPAYNRPDGDHVDENGDPFHAQNEGIGLLLSIDDTTIYVTGDTDFLDEHEHLTADVFIPPIGGHYTMDRHDAAAFVEHVGPDLVLPVHYDTFEPIETDAEAFKADVETNGPTVRLF